VNPFSSVRRIFYYHTSGLAIFLVKRRLKKNPKDPSKWILLAKLFEIRESKPDAIRAIKLGLEIFPKNPLLRAHLDRLQGRASQTK